MNLWAVTMVKDEIDIIAHTLLHLDSEGVDGIIVADNLSSDGTRELIKDLKLDCELFVVVDGEIGYYQAQKMTDLVREAFACGADWVIPFDADELWYSPRGPLDAVVLDAYRQTNANCLEASLHNYFPTSSDDPTETNPYKRITHRDRCVSDLHKVIVRRGAVELTQGNHDAIGPAPFVKATFDIRVAHFPWRGWSRFRSKVINGARAYKATDLDPEIGKHWRQYGQIFETEGDEGLKAVYDTWFHDPAMVDLVEEPAPWCHHIFG